VCGNCTISGNTTVAKANPIRYRGYYYDEDTGLYYCNARYYSPKWRRFISPDSTAYLDAESVNGLNQYCYCNNDPINYTDPSGRSAILISVIIGAVLGGIYGGVSAAANGQNVLGGI
jgi:RHS repeat-associated protein